MARPAGAGIKGNVLISRLKFVRERADATGLERVLASLPPDDRQALSGWILPISWYPLELCIRLDRAIARELSPDDPSRVFLEMGRASADANLSGPQRPFVRPGDPHFLLQSAPLIYAAYYATGRRTYERTGDTSAVLRTFDADAVTATDCLTVVGWHVRAIELSGGTDVKVVERRCRARGDDCCEYGCEWT